MRIGWDAEQRARAVKLLVLDVDGVLTDGRIVVDDRGCEAKFFHVHDGSAVWFLRRAGIESAIISGRRVPCVEHRARDLGIVEVHQGSQVKAAALDAILKTWNLSDKEVAYMGDDVLDVPLLKRVGLPAAPASARPEAKSAALVVTDAAGGHGAVRELAEFILRSQNAWEKLLREHYGVSGVS
jgi:3-deoxy-D-manno-octulosonate 8-phosphate phosphatase (KDO 8-P phosphatase)